MNKYFSFASSCLDLFIGLFMGVLVVSCSPQKNLDLVARVENRNAIDEAVKKWQAFPSLSFERAEAMNVISSCAKNTASNEESRAYCFAAMVDLSNESAEAAAEIEGLVLPNRVIALSRMIQEIQTANVR
jgi:hypothetical protein